jgi:hypothetical protein
MIIELFYACMDSEFQSEEGSTQTRRIRCCLCITEHPQNHAAAGRSAATRKGKPKTRSNRRISTVEYLLSQC